MKTNPSKSHTDTFKLTLIFEIISQMPSSIKDDVDLPSRGADKQTYDTSHTVPPIGQTEPGVVAPNPIAGKSTTDDMIVRVANPKGTDPGNIATRRAKMVRVLPKTPRLVVPDPATGQY